MFLALAPFLPKPRLLGIFGRNLLDDDSQRAGFDALMEYHDHKPFECVGEGAEARAAMHALSQRPEWREDALVARFAEEIRPQLDAAELDMEPWLEAADAHGIPARLAGAAGCDSRRLRASASRSGARPRGPRRAGRAARAPAGPAADAVLPRGRGGDLDGGARTDVIRHESPDADGAGGASTWWSSRPAFPPTCRPSRRRSERGTRFTSGTALWFAERPDARVIGITGTKGKSTASAMTAHLARALGVRTALAGNIGLPLLELLDAEAELWVAELSSFQTGDAGPLAVGVVTSLYEEHLDWHGSRERYVADKLQAGRCRAHACWSMPRSRTWWRAPPRIRAASVSAPDKAGTSPTAPSSAAASACSTSPTLALPGAHNAPQCLRRAGRAGAGRPRRRRRGARAGDDSVPCRTACRLWASADGISWINDSISTTPLRRAGGAAQPGGPARAAIVLGGHDRGLDWGVFAAALAAPPPRTPWWCRAPTARASSRRCMRPACAGSVLAASDLDGAVARAREALPRGGVVLLSPGAPSFDQFRDYTERGRRFAALAGFDPARIASIEGLGMA